MPLERYPRPLKDTHQLASLSPPLARLANRDTLIITADEAAGGV